MSHRPESPAVPAERHATRIAAHASEPCNEVDEMTGAICAQAQS